MKALKRITLRRFVTTPKVVSRHVNQGACEKMGKSRIGMAGAIFATSQPPCECRYPGKATLPFLAGSAEAHVSTYVEIIAAKCLIHYRPSLFKRSARACK